MKHIIDKPARNNEKTYISFYADRDAIGGVLYRRIVNLPWNHGTVWKIARRECDQKGFKSFALLQCVTVRNHYREGE